MTTKKITYLRIVITPAIFVAALLLVFIQFFISIDNGIEKSTYEDLQLTAEQHVSTLEAKLNGQYALLESLAVHTLGDFENMGADEIVHVLDSIAQTNGFDVVGAAGADGRAYTSGGETVFIGDRGYFVYSVTGGRAIERVENPKLTETDSIVMSVPLMSGDAAVSGVLFGTIFTRDFEKSLVSSAYGENTYSFIADDCGEIIVKSSNPNFLHQSGNIFDIIKSTNKTKTSYERFCENLSANVSGISELDVNGSERYILYTALSKAYDGPPRGAENWFLFTSVPKAAVQAKNAYFSRTMAIIAAELAVIAAAAVVYIIYYSRKKAKKALSETEAMRQSVEMYRIVNEFSDNIIVSFDRADNNVSFNNVYERVFKRKPFMGKTENFEQPNPYVNRYDLSAYTKFMTDLRNGLPKATAEFRILRPDGLYDWYKAEATTLYGQNGDPTKTIGKLSNVQEHHTAIEELTLRAESDSLTRIYNHTSMKDKVNRYLGGGGKEGLHALLYIDLDNFKAVNDTMGHLAGDNLLVEIAQKMQEIFRETDIVGRMGGDEFAVFIKDLNGEAAIRKKAQSLIESINFMTIPNSVTHLSCSVGAAVYTKDGANFEELYCSADKALYKAKKIKNTYLFFSPDDIEMTRGAHEHVSITLPDYIEPYENDDDGLDDPSEA